MPAATATIRTRHDALQAVFAAEPGNGPLLTGLLHFLNQRDVAQLFGQRAPRTALSSLAGLSLTVCCVSVLSQL